MTSDDASLAREHARRADDCARAGRWEEATRHGDAAADLDPAFEGVGQRFGQWRAFGRNASRSAYCPLELWPAGASARRLWRAEFAPSGGAWGPVIARDWVLVPTANGELAALDRRTGVPRWLRTPGSRNRDARLSDAAVAHDRVVIASQSPEEGRLHAFDLESGESLWDVATGSAAESWWQNVSAPAIARRKVITISDLRVLAFDLCSGKSVWSSDVLTAAAEAPVAIDGGTVLVAGEKIHALDVETGVLLWTVDFPTPEEDFQGIPIVAMSEGRGVCGDYFGFEVVAMADGSSLHYVSEGNGYGCPGLAVAGHDVIAVGPSRAHSFDIARGVRRWSVCRSRRTVAGPVVAAGTVLIADATHLFALSRETGESLSTTLLEEPIQGVPALALGQIFAFTESAIVAFEAAG
jgi:outer membrane protein assembly factor BamB